MKIRKMLIMFVIISTSMAFGQDGHECACGHSEKADKQSMKMNHPMPASNIEAHAMVKLPTVQCGVCKSTIEAGLMKSPGVHSVNVDIEGKIAHINYDAKKISQAKIEAAISLIGYQANDIPADAEAYEGLPACCKVS